MRNLTDRNRPFQEILFLLTAVITGLSITLLWFTTPPYGWNPYEISLREYAASEWDTHYMDFLLPAMAFISATLFYGTRRLLRALATSYLPFGDSVDLYRRYDTKTYYIFYLLLLGIFGIYLQIFIVFLLFVLLQAALLFFILKKNRDWIDNDLTLNSGILLLFFTSGFSALIYQIAWQRKLFQSFGVNIESVTIIVSIFMFGLGIGAVIGGLVSKRFPAALLHIFLISELLIGVFGLFSLRLIEHVNNLTLHSPLIVISLAIYAILLLPTALMGATLPILVAHLHDRIKNIGKSVSILYCVNTLGSAFAAFATIHLLFYLTGLSSSIRVAAFLNFSVAFLGFAFIRNIKTADAVTHPGESSTEHTVSDRRQALIWALSFIIGYISLSQEILWVRLASYATGSKSTVFGNVLGCFLVGIALGAWHAKNICERYDKDKLINLTGSLLVAASVVYYLMVPILSWLATILWKGVFPLLYVGVGVVSYLMGAVFPLLCHYVIRSKKAVGLSVSGIYFFNILGSTAGPVVTGFFLLDRFPIETNIMTLSLMTFILGSSLWIASNRDSTSRKTAYIVGISSVTIFLLHPVVYHHLLERFYYKHKYYNHPPFKYTAQNRSGIINVVPSDKEDDIVIGNGLYDGRINTSLINNRNGIDRAYMIAALHPKPVECLQIGLSGGSWARVLANHGEVKSLDIVEINPAYFEIIKNYQENRSLLKYPRITIHINDGRRWMLKNKDRRFDFILMDTTNYWRAQINDLVSKDFLLLAKRHLKPGGVIYFNATGSIDIPYTTAHVFKYVTSYENFIAASDSPFPEEFELKKRSLEKFYFDGRPVFDPEDTFLQNELRKLAAYDLSNRRDRILQSSDLSYLITDDNLASEFKTGKRFFSFRRNWLQMTF